jgi:hypothetical protein
LEEKLPARRQTPAEAYAKIERALNERKQEQLFYEWLNLAEAGARIRVAGVFVQEAERGMRSVRPRPAAGDDPPDSEPIAPDSADAAAMPSAPPENAAPARP